MTFNTMIELVKMHHPDIQKSVIAAILNSERRRFAARTKINRSIKTISTVNGERYYAFPDNVEEIVNVYYLNKEVQREVNPPVYTDDDSLAD